MSHKPIKKRSRRPFTFLFLTVAACLCLTPLSVVANSDNRDWTLKDGTRFNADLITYNVETDHVKLRIDVNTVKEIPFTQFSAVDRAWLLEWAEFSQELAETKAEMEGLIERYQTEDEHKTVYYVYYPSAYAENKTLPLLFLFHPSGKGERYVQRMMLAAEVLDLIIISSDDFRNRVDGKERFEALLPVLDKQIDYDKNRFYLGGTSGGGMCAFGFTAHFTGRHWAGVWSNGGWLGGKTHRETDFPDGLRVAIVNGDSDLGANRWVEHDKKILNKHKAVIGLFAFEGGHQIPPPLIQVKSLRWLLSDAPTPDPIKPPEQDPADELESPPSP